MFFREPQHLTIDQVDLSTLSITDNSDYFPHDLKDCISCAVAACKDDVNPLTNIVETIKAKSAGKVSLDRIIEQIYFDAILYFSRDMMEKLLTAIPIDINRSIRHVYQGMCQPPVLQRDGLLNIAVAFLKPDMVDFLLSKGADVRQVSNDNETPEQELERVLAEDRTSSEPYQMATKEKMLESIKAANQPSLRASK